LEPLPALSGTNEVQPNWISEEQRLAISISPNSGDQLPSGVRIKQVSNARHGQARQFEIVRLTVLRTRKFTDTIQITVTEAIEVIPAEEGQKCVATDVFRGLGLSVNSRIPSVHFVLPDFRL